MPELPEVETIKKGLSKAILGKKIKSVDVRLPKLISLGPATVSNIRTGGRAEAEKFKRILRGQKIKGVKRRAKMLIVDLSGIYALTIHLKMTGQFIFAKKSELPKQAKILNKPNGQWLTLPHKHTHIIFNFTDGSKLYYNDMRQFGYIRLVCDTELDKVKELKEFGPEPFSEDYTFPHFKDKAGARNKLTIKQFIVDPRVIAGVGNIYSDEILYCAGVRPDRKVGRLKEAELKKTFQCTPRILREGIKYQGSSVGDYFKIDGSEGTYGQLHRVYGRAGLLCKRCHSVIKSVKLGGRTGSYCPKCQR